MGAVRLRALSGVLRIHSCRGRLRCASDAPHVDGAVVDGGKEVERSTMVVPTRRPE